LFAEGEFESPWGYYNYDSDRLRASMKIKKIRRDNQ
jgi:hypothetical protein